MSRMNRIAVASSISRPAARFCPSSLSPRPSRFTAHLWPCSYAGTAQGHGRYGVCDALARAWLGVFLQNVSPQRSAARLREPWPSQGRPWWEGQRSAAGVSASSACMPLPSRRAVKARASPAASPCVVRRADRCQPVLLLPPRPAGAVAVACGVHARNSDRQLFTEGWLLMLKPNLSACHCSFCPDSVSF